MFFRSESISTSVESSRCGERSSFEMICRDRVGSKSAIANRAFITSKSLDSKFNKHIINLIMFYKLDLLSITRSLFS